MKAWHMLLVDLDPVRRDQLAAALRGAGFQVVTAGSGPQAAEALAVPGLGAVLLDLDLPDLDLAALRRALSPASDAAPDALEAAERRHIASMLRYTRGNKRRAAQLLGIARSTLLAKVRKYALEPAGAEVEP